MDAMPRQHNRYLIAPEGRGALSVYNSAYRSRSLRGRVRRFYPPIRQPPYSLRQRRLALPIPVRTTCFQYLSYPKPPENSRAYPRPSSPIFPRLPLLLLPAPIEAPPP